MWFVLSFLFNYLTVLLNKNYLNLTNSNEAATNAGGDIRVSVEKRCQNNFITLMNSKLGLGRLPI